MSDDIQTDPVPPSKSEPPDDYGLGNGEDPPFPRLVTVAGWMWIVLGMLTLVLVSLVAAAAMIFAGGANAGGKDSGAHLAGGLWALGGFGVFGAGLLSMGVQSVRGKARHVQGSGVVSIGIGLLYCGMAAVKVAGGQILQASVVRITYVGIEGMGGVLLLVAGVLALVGRGQYQLWRVAHKSREDRDRRNTDNPFRK